MDQNRNEVSIEISNHSSLNKGNRLNPNKSKDQLVNIIFLKLYLITKHQTQMISKS